MLNLIDRAEYEVQGKKRRVSKKEGAGPLEKELESLIYHTFNEHDRGSAGPLLKQHIHKVIFSKA